MFWSVVAALLALISIPSIDWIDTAHDYASLATQWQPAPLKPTTTSRTPHENRENDPAESDLRPMEFSVDAPRAQNVELIGDFNHWTAGLTKLKRGRKGRYSVVLPIHVGRLRYVFVVDGKPFLDPGASRAKGPKGETVSERSVE